MPVDSSTTSLTMASFPWRGGEHAEDFHLWRAIDLSSGTASGGNIKCAATFLRSQWLPCLDTVSLTKAKNKFAGNETAVEHNFVQYTCHLKGYTLFKTTE